MSKLEQDISRLRAVGPTGRRHRHDRERPVAARTVAAHMNKELRPPQARWATGGISPGSGARQSRLFSEVDALLGREIRKVLMPRSIAIWRANWTISRNSW